LRSIFRRALATTLGLWLAACAGTVAPPGPPHRAVSDAYAHPEATALGHVFEPLAERHPGLSGFDLIQSGRTAFDARFALAGMAQRTIDAQYYIWAPDAIGRNMMAAMIAAADRGVRVRLLLDDLDIEGRDDAFATLAAHPNIEVRLFNPSADRSLGLGNYLFDFNRVNHRMHNKAFIVDNTVAIVGGRNIANPYFSADPDADFRDLDLLAAGKIVRDVSSNFDAFWNSAWAVPIHRLAQPPKDAEDLKALEERLQHKRQSEPFPFRDDLREPLLAKLVAGFPQRLVWAKATLFADRPDKPETQEPGVVDDLRAAEGSGKIKQELLIESAYFVPTKDAAERYCALAHRGVRLRVLTNSLASTDEVAVYGGYMRERERLLRCGVELHELRPDAAYMRRQSPWPHTRSEAELHTKAAVFDRAQVMIGSFNLDPRSRVLNTEMAVFVESPDLAGEVARFIDRGMSLANSFHVVLDEEGNTVWLAEDDGHAVRFCAPPASSAWRRLKADMLGLLPIEGLL